MTNPLRILLLVLLLGWLIPSPAEDRLQLDQTTVIDNHELPKITYIVPWQSAQTPAPEKPPMDILVDDALAPLDREVLRGQIHYYYEIAPTAGANGRAAEKTSK